MILEKEVAEAAEIEKSKICSAIKQNPRSTSGERLKPLPLRPSPHIFNGP